jgi:hypothetical protein
MLRAVVVAGLLAIKGKARTQITTMDKAAAAVRANNTLRLMAFRLEAALA